MSEYNQVLQEVEKHLAPSIGFSDHDSPKEDSRIIIRQNNTILQLLVQILEKLNSEKNKELVLPSSGVLASTNSINSDKWIYLKASQEETKPSYQ
jgi:metallophosphoesterase superfamily enzyme